MTTTPFRGDRQEDWDSGRAFRTLPGQHGRVLARRIARMDDDDARTLLDPAAALTVTIAHSFACGRQAVSDTARSVLWCRGLLDELVFP
jgi:predicted ATPase